MEDVSVVFSSIWGLVWDFRIGSVPVVLIFLGMSIIALLIRFLKGKK